MGSPKAVLLYLTILPLAAFVLFSVVWTADEFFHNPAWSCPSDDSYIEGHGDQVPHRLVPSPDGTYTAIVVERSCWMKDRTTQTVLLSRTPVVFPLSHSNLVLSGMFWNTTISIAWSSEAQLNIDCVSSPEPPGIPHSQEMWGVKRTWEGVGLVHTGECSWMDH